MEPPTDQQGVEAREEDEAKHSVCTSSNITRISDHCLGGFVDHLNALTISLAAVTLRVCRDSVSILLAY